MPCFWKDNKGRIILFLAILLCVLMAMFLNIFYYRVVVVDGQKFIARLAVNPDVQKKGLGGRKNMCQNCAMLFEFQKCGQYSFWMKGMSFDLDILWINGKKIVYIQKNFSHNSSEIITPKVAANKVLEIKAGLSDQYGLKAGDEIETY